MNPPSGQEFCRFIEQNGWVLLRQHGSHRVYGKAGEAIRLAIPVHGNAPLKLGLFKGLLKEAGLSWP